MDPGVLGSQAGARSSVIRKPGRVFHDGKPGITLTSKTNGGNISSSGSPLAPVGGIVKTD